MWTFQNDCVLRSIFVHCSMYSILWSGINIYIYIYRIWMISKEHFTKLSVSYISIYSSVVIFFKNWNETKLRLRTCLCVSAPSVFQSQTCPCPWLAAGGHKFYEVINPMFTCFWSRYQNSGKVPPKNLIFTLFAYLSLRN